MTLKNLEELEDLNGKGIIHLDEAKNDPKFQDENGQFDWEVFDKFRAHFPISIAKSQNMISFKLADDENPEKGCTADTLMEVAAVLSKGEETKSLADALSKTPGDSALIEHAKREFVASGYTPLDQEQEDGPNKWIQENLLELLRTFGAQGHSGASASYCINMFNKLANYEPLTPLTLAEDEFNKLDIEDNKILQNIRDSRVYIIEEEGKARFMHAIVWRNYENNEHFSGAAYLPNSDTAIESSQILKGPCVPQSFFVPVFHHAEKDRYIIMEPEKYLQAVSDSGLYEFEVTHTKQEIKEDEENKPDTDK